MLRCCKTKSTVWLLARVSLKNACEFLRAADQNKILVSLRRTPAPAHSLFPSLGFQFCGSSARRGGARGQNIRNPGQRAEGVAETRPPAPQTAAGGTKGTSGANHPRCAVPNRVRRNMMGGLTRLIRTVPTNGTFRPDTVFSFVIPCLCLNFVATKVGRADGVRKMGFVGGLRSN